MLPAVLRTDQLVLHRWRVDDLASVMAAIGLSLDELRPWMPWARTMPTIETERAALEASRRRFDRGDDFEYFLFETSGGELVGAAGLHPRAPGIAMIGYWVRTDRHRRGYATEAARTLTCAGFEHLPNIHTIEIRMDRANVASARVPAKLGYSLVGDEPREIVTPGHTGRGLVWRTTRPAWGAQRADESGSVVNEECSPLEPLIPGDHPQRSGLAALRRQLERHWCADTSFWPDEWTPERPSLGQCAVTAMIVHDRFGGEILRTVNQGVVHYWNRVDGMDVDLTRDQFDGWTPEDDIVTVDRDDVGSSGPTIAARHRQLAAALGNRAE